MKLLIPFLLLTLSACTITPLTSESRCPDIYIDPIIVDVQISDIKDYCPAVNPPSTYIPPEPKIVTRTKPCYIPSLVTLNGVVPFDITEFENDPNVLLKESLRLISSITELNKNIQKEYLKCQ